MATDPKNPAIAPLPQPHQAPGAHPGVQEHDGSRPMQQPEATPPRTPAPGEKGGPSTNPSGGTDANPAEPHPRRDDGAFTPRKPDPRP